MYIHFLRCTLLTPPTQVFLYVVQAVTFYLALTSSRAESASFSLNKFALGPYRDIFGLTKVNWGFCCINAVSDIF